MEITTVIYEDENVRVVKHVSNGCATPEGEWYDQDESEYCVVVKGKATLEYSDGERIEFPTSNGHRIPPHRKHRVLSTSDDCVWICSFLKED